MERFRPGGGGIWHGSELHQGTETMKTPRRRFLTGTTALITAGLIEPLPILATQHQRHEDVENGADDQ